MLESQDEYYEPIIFKEPGWTIKVYKPILTDMERARREKRREQAAAALLMAKYEAERKQANK